MKPITEKPINSLDDAFTRGENIWVKHITPDPTKPHIKVQWLLPRLNPRIQKYIMDRGTTYSAVGGGTPEHVWNDIQENGASVVYRPDPPFFKPRLVEEYKVLRRGTENQLNILYLRTIFTPKFAPWLADVDLFIMQFQSHGLLQKMFIDYFKNFEGFGRLEVNEKDENERIIELDHLYTTLMILAAGYGLGLFAFIHELAKGGSNIPVKNEQPISTWRMVKMWLKMRLKPSDLR